MSDVLKPIDIVGNVHNANLQAEKMRYEAGRLELSAKNYRTHAAEQVIEGFEEANRYLVATWQSGEFSDADLLRTQLELREADPIIRRAKNEPSTEELLARFAMLTPGTPILRLGNIYYSDRRGTGIISEAPSNFHITPATIYRNDDTSRVRIVNTSYSPTASFDLPFKGVEAKQPTDKLLTLDSLNLRYGAIGREAIAQLAAEAEFTTGTDRAMCHPQETTNHHTLAALRADIDALYQLGMKRVNTKPLDNALKQAQSYQDHRIRRQRSRLEVRKARLLQERGHWY